MQFTTFTMAALLAVASAELVVLDSRGILDDLTSKASSKFASATDKIGDKIESGTSEFKAATSTFSDASRSASYKADPSAFTFPNVKTATDNADKLYEYITSVDRFIPTKVVDEWKDAETPEAVADFVKDLPAKWTGAAKDGWASLSKEVKLATATAEAKKDDKDDDKDEDDKKDDDKKDDKKDDDDEESGALRTVGISAGALFVAFSAGMAIVL
ncbi:hypothetical protein BJ508DRAFT_418315 [Ascobolus immersus RN42]|uniref:Uncharacterized protein n=1 Tax=Ascobolus immersus RN42 TaxID=1160509 RepID=A0A3N4HMN1_ASCIM|nr:hypothetical protein BJ508DRAFT_418315 [Ascobolus immersus RN42]